MAAILQYGGYRYYNISSMIMAAIVITISLQREWRLSLLQYLFKESRIETVNKITSSETLR